MQVNVFVTRADGQLKNQLLVLPLSPQSAIPAEYREGWSYYATVDIGDRMFGAAGHRVIEAELGAAGYALVTSRAPDRRS